MLVKLKFKSMKSLLLKLFLVAALLFVFVAFQYGGPVGDAPFKGQWQSWAIFAALVIAVGMLVHELFFKKKNL